MNETIVLNGWFFDLIEWFTGQVNGMPANRVSRNSKAEEEAKELGKKNGGNRKGRERERERTGEDGEKEKTS